MRKSMGVCLALGFALVLALSVAGCAAAPEGDPNPPKDAEARNLTGPGLEVGKAVNGTKEPSAKADDPLKITVPGE